MAVDLPAPFSPITPWIVTASTRRLPPALDSAMDEFMNGEIKELLQKLLEADQTEKLSQA